MSHLTKKTYLNTAACGLLEPAVVAAANDFNVLLSAEGSSRSEQWRREDEPRIRSVIAAFIGASARNVAVVPNFSWALNGIVQETSGQPYQVNAGGDPLNVGCCLTERMNVTGNPNAGAGTHSQQEWFNTSAFAAPTGFTYGNEKVNSLVSQHFNDVDMSLFRNFHLGLGEQRYFEFRAESFNLFNNVVWGTPDNTNTDANYGQITGQRNSPRQLQMSLKFYY